MEILLAAIAEAVFAILIGDLSKQPKLYSLRNLLRGDSVEKVSFQRALASAYLEFTKIYPDLSSSLFDQWFIHSSEVVFELSKTLTPDQEPDVMVISQNWKSQFYDNPDIELQEPITFFISELQVKVKSESSLKPFVDSRALDQLYMISDRAKHQINLQTEIRDLLADIHRLIDESGTDIKNRKPIKQTGRLHSNNSPKNQESIISATTRSKIFKSNYEWSMLVVEDEQIARRSLVNLLRREFPFIMIHSARSGKEAVRKFDKELYDIILLDMNLGHSMTGLDVFSTLRNRDYRFRSIAITAYAGDYGYAAGRLGIDAYVNKPLDMTELFKTIREQLKYITGNPIQEFEKNS